LDEFDINADSSSVLLKENTNKESDAASDFVGSKGRTEDVDIDAN
jgi:hypothetical protein